MNAATSTPPTVALIAIARPTFDVLLAQSVAAAAADAIQSAGFVLAGSGSELIMDADGVAAVQARLEETPFDLLVLLQASFADSSMAVSLASVAHARGVPILLWAVPDTRDGGRLRLNSLCGINLAGHALTLYGISYEYVLAPIGDAAAPHTVGVLARAGRALRTLRNATIGVVGRHPGGFETCQYDEADLRSLLGVTVAPLELTAVLESARRAGQAERQEFLERVRVHALNLDELDAQATNGTAGVYVALRRLVEDDGLSGVAVRCWPEFFTDLGCAACGAMSMLGDDLTALRAARWMSTVRSRRYCCRAWAAARLLSPTWFRSTRRPTRCLLALWPGSLCHGRPRCRCARDDSQQPQAAAAL
jgi:L-fucose isomerase-like protein